MRRLPRKLWHAVHLSSFPMFIFATVHGFTAGADNMNLAVQWGALTGGLLVIFLVMFRFLVPRRSSKAARARRASPTHGDQPRSVPALATDVADDHRWSSRRAAEQRARGRRTLTSS